MDTCQYGAISMDWGFSLTGWKGFGAERGLMESPRCCIEAGGGSIPPWDIYERVNGVFDELRDRPRGGTVKPPHIAGLKDCLHPPPAAVYEAARLLRCAVDAHNASDRERASKLFKDANLPEVREWTESLWGKGWGKRLTLQFVPNAPAYLPRAERVPVRMPTSAGQKVLIARDGYHCRFCAIPLVHKRIRDRVKAAYPESVTWGSTNPSQHAAFQAMWMQFDHLVPHSRGGSNEAENVLVTCAPCNYARFHYTFEEVGLRNPLMRPPDRSDWNGLEDFAIERN